MNLVCFSGGLDSAVVLRLAMREGATQAAGFDYGQRHARELNYACHLAFCWSVPFKIYEIQPIPLLDDVVFAGRNLVLAAHAISLAQSIGANSVWFGCNRTDWERFPDCRPEFWEHLGTASRAAYGIKVVTPLLTMTKREIVQLAADEGIALADTWSCYDPQGTEPCGRCLACIVRAEAS